MSIGAPEYRAYMQSAGWKRRRVDALTRSSDRIGPRCEVCGRHGNSYKNSIESRYGEGRIPGANGLEVHHLHYRNLGEEPPEDLIVLCTDVLFYYLYDREYWLWRDLPPDQRASTPYPRVPNRVGCHERAHDDRAFRLEVERIAGERW